jgi:hypothetical protein
MTKKLFALSEFSKLSPEHQLQLLHCDGVHVGKRKVGRRTVVLLQLYGFYVEVHYKVYRKEIHHLITSKNTDILQPYLNQINIPDLNAGKSKE